MLDTGAMIGKYKVVRLLGKGGMGAVCLAWDETLKREVAVKVISPNLEGVVNALRRFQAEAQAIARLADAHIVQIHDFEPTANPPYIVMEYIRGQSLAQYIESQAPLPLAAVLDCGRQVLQGLAAAHKAGIIHRDIKPANILRSEEGVIKLTDFGLARSLDVESGLTAEGVVVGTIHYLSPEVAQGEPATAQSDLYSAGVTLYEMLAGEVPFHDDSPLKLIGKIARETPTPIRAHRGDLPPAIEAWLAKMLERDLSRRYGSAPEALADLAKVSAGSIQPGDPLHESDIASTSATPGAPSPARSQSPSPVSTHPDKVEAGTVQAGDVDTIISRALTIERAGRNILDEKSLIEIAADVGVSPDAVRQAVAGHRAAQQARQRALARARTIGIAAVALVAVAGIAWWFLHRPPRIETGYNTTGGNSGQVKPGEKPKAPAVSLAVGASWADAGLTFIAGKQALLVRVTEGGSVEGRIGGGEPFRKPCPAGLPGCRRPSATAPAIAAKSFLTKSDLLLYSFNDYSFDSQGLPEYSQPNWITPETDLDFIYLDLQAVTPMNAVYFVKEIFNGKTNFHVIPCNSDVAEAVKITVGESFYDSSGVEEQRGFKC